MPESLDAYRKRTQFMWNSLPLNSSLDTPESLNLKVNPDGSFRPFYGDTILYTLDKHSIAWLQHIQDILYERCGHALSSRIDPATFHITLHDLTSRSQAMPEEMKTNQTHAFDIIQTIQASSKHAQTIVSKCLFNMVNTSITMGFEPLTDEDCLVLTKSYEEFQRIVPLSYPLTLHVTLAYYKPGQYDQQLIDVLQCLFMATNHPSHVIKLTNDHLTYATFHSMNHYIFY